MATYSVDYLSRLIDATERFEGAFERWMETQEERDLVSARGLLLRYGRRTTKTPDGFESSNWRWRRQQEAPLRQYP